MSALIIVLATLCLLDALSKRRRPKSSEGWAEGFDKS